MTTAHTYLVVYKRHGVRETTQSGYFGMEFVELYNIARTLILIRQRKKKEKENSSAETDQADPGAIAAVSVFTVFAQAIPAPKF